jgi:hypothetical protein
MNMSKIFRKLCTPAKVYLVLSFISVVIYVMSMTSYGSKIKMLHGTDTQPHTLVGLVVQVVWVILWTALLNYIHLDVALRNVRIVSGGRVRRIHETTGTTTGTTRER